MSGRFRTIRTLLRKELLDVLRDRRTLFLSLGLPVLLYPLMIAATGLMMVVGREQLKNEDLVVAVVSDDAQGLLGRQPLPPHTTLQRMSRVEGEGLLRDQKVAAVVDTSADAGVALTEGRQAVVTVVYTKRFDRSMEGLHRLRPLLETVNTQVLATRLEERQLDAAFAMPVKTTELDLDFERDLGPLIASRVLPITLIMMLLIGAMYPAVDLIAGEKERGTFETLLVASVRPFDVLVAKYVTVSTLAIVSTLANLGAMAVTFGAGVSFDEKVSMTFHFTFGQVLVMFACLVPAALLVSGISLAVASVARTFKEGQTLMTPVLLVGIAPAMLSQMPGIELGPLTALVPILNVALLVKAAVLGTAQPLHVALTIGSVLLFSVFALWLAAAAFESELFRFAGTGGWGAVFRLGKRR